MDSNLFYPHQIFSDAVHITAKAASGPASGFNKTIQVGDKYAFTFFDDMFFEPSGKFCWQDLPEEMRDLIIARTLEAAAEDSKRRLATKWREWQKADPRQCPQKQGAPKEMFFSEVMGDRLIKRMVRNCEVATSLGCRRADLPEQYRNEPLVFCTDGSHQTSLLYQATAKQPCLDHEYSVWSTVDALRRFAPNNRDSVHRHLFSIFRRGVEDAEALEAQLFRCVRRTLVIRRWMSALMHYRCRALADAMARKFVALFSGLMFEGDRLNEAIVFAKTPKEILLRAGWINKVEPVKQACKGTYVKKFIFNEETILETLTVLRADEV